MMYEYIIQTNHVSKKFKKTYAIKDLSMSVLKMITGIIRPTSGEILFNNQPWIRKDLLNIGSLIESPPIQMAKRQRAVSLSFVLLRYAIVMLCCMLLCCHATERLWRGDAARGADGHHGLGLWFAAQVAKTHAGQLELRNCDSGGVVTMKFR